MTKLEGVAYCGTYHVRRAARGRRGRARSGRRATRSSAAPRPQRVRRCAAAAPKETTLRLRLAHHLAPSYHIPCTTYNIIYSVQAGTAVRPQRVSLA